MKDLAGARIVDSVQGHLQAIEYKWVRNKPIGREVAMV
jgi:hypothetical protein